MNDLEAAALRLALFSLAFLAAAIFVWRLRRPRSAPRARAPRAWQRLPKARRSRVAEPEVHDVPVAPERLARISQAVQSPVDLGAEVEIHGGASRDRAVPPVPAPAPPAAFPPAGTEAAASDEGGRDAGALPSDAMPDAADELAERAGVTHAGNGVRLALRRAEPDAGPPPAWVGGGPHLPPAMAWPQMGGHEADFVAQVDCAALPAGLWDGLGPRRGWLALFVSPDDGAPLIEHFEDSTQPRDPPRAPGMFWSPPVDDLGSQAIHAFPAWTADVHPATAACPPPAIAEGYDVADPAYHPFDWASLAAMARTLDTRLALLDAGPAGSADLLPSLGADAAAANRTACKEAKAIIALVREACGHGTFDPAGAAAVMEGLREIHWHTAARRYDVASGTWRVAPIELPLTRHHTPNDLWVADYRALLFDHARHALCRDASTLPPALRAWVEAECTALGASDAITLGGEPQGFVPGFDRELDALLFTLPPSRLTAHGPARSGGPTLVALRKVELATGNFAAARLVVRAD